MPTSSHRPAAQLKTLDLPPGFRIAFYTNTTLQSARSLTVSGASKEWGPVITYVGSRTAVSRPPGTPTYPQLPPPVTRMQPPLPEGQGASSVSATHALPPAPRPH